MKEKKLMEAFDDIIYMAIRYAHCRRTAAPDTVRRACEIRAKYGDFKLRYDDTLTSDMKWHKNPRSEDDLRGLLEIYK